MSDLFYRFKFKSDLFELELESTDSEFIDRKIMQLIELSTRPIEDGPKLLSAAAPATREEANIEEAMPEEEEEAEEEAPAQPKKKTRKRRKRKTVPKPRKSKTTGKKAPAPEEGEIDAAAIADAVKSSDHYKTIKNKILNKANQLNRILLSFYFTEQLYDKKGLTTGDVEAITEALGAGIKSTNVSSQLKKHSNLFNSRGERKRGSVVYYTLNKEGRERFENLLQSAM